MRITLIAAAVVALTACGGSQSAGGPNPDSLPHHPPEATTSATAPAATVSEADAVAVDAVTIRDFLFVPAVIKVKSGTTVTWTNEDTEPHTVSVSGPGGFTSPVLTRGARFSHSFTAPATVAYICSIHPYMKGGVIVGPA